MKKIIMLLTLMSAATPAMADANFDWQRPANLKILHKGFTRVATECSEHFGFTAVKTPPEDVMLNKIESRLLLSNTPDEDVQHWTAMAMDVWEVDLAPKRYSLVQRTSDAVLAAAKDPDNYAAGELLYVETIRPSIDTSVKGCQRFADDPFFATYYVRGHGSGDQYVAQLKGMFAENVADTRATMTKLKKR